MPTYEYECDKCRRVFEVRQRISEPALTTCDECGGAVRRLLSPAPFILKGDGWYVTDYPSEARKKGREAEKTPTTTSDAKTGTASKSTTDAKSGADSKSGTDSKGSTESKTTATASSSSPSSSSSSS
jgi:putative FmdB family regulatory protein